MRISDWSSDVCSSDLFVAAINTITARTTVINELYRIMRIVGYPRMDVTVLQEVIERNVPPNIKDNPTEIRAYVSRELDTIRGVIAGLSARDAFEIGSASFREGVGQYV